MQRALVDPIVVARAGVGVDMLAACGLALLGAWAGSRVAEKLAIRSHARVGHLPGDEAFLPKPILPTLGGSAVTPAVYVAATALCRHRGRHGALLWLRVFGWGSGVTAVAGLCLAVWVLSFHRADCAR